MPIDDFKGENIVYVRCRKSSGRRRRAAERDLPIPDTTSRRPAASETVWGAQEVKRTRFRGGCDNWVLVLGFRAGSRLRRPCQGLAQESTGYF